MPSNQHRASRVELMLMEYRDVDDEASLADLLTDAMHYCEIHGKDFARVLQCAERHFEFERRQNSGGGND